jgi:hypothetical protein
MSELENRLPEDTIRLRSYLIWEREGCPHGKEFDHWRRAKEELQAEFHAGPFARRPMAFVMPRIPISARPNQIVSTRLILQQSAARANAARQ